MANHGEFVLSFVNRVRSIQELDDLGAIDVTSGEPDDQDLCFLAQALGCQVTVSQHPVWAQHDRFVMRFADRALARTVGICTEQEWTADHREVALPDEITALVVASHLATVMTDELGFLHGWWVPEDVDENRGGQLWQFHAMPGYRIPGQDISLSELGPEDRLKTATA